MVEFEFSRIRLEYTALTDFNQPYFLGSSIRGVLGKRLRKIVCIKPREDCKVCEFNKTCPYTVIFETELYLNMPSKYVLQPEYNSRQLKEGDKLNIDITLLGFASNYWEFIIQSLNTVINLGKERFIKQSGIYYYHPFASSYEPLKSVVPRFNAKDFFDIRTGKEKINVRLFPTSLKFGGRYIKANEFSKDYLIKAVVSRISNIAQNYGSKTGKIFIDKSKLEISDQNMKPSPLKRWSNRKKKKMTVPAFEGNFKLKGNINEIYPYLLILENINLGKSTSFGLDVVRTDI